MPREYEALRELEREFQRSPEDMDLILRYVREARRRGQYPVLVAGRKRPFVIVEEDEGFMLYNLPHLGGFVDVLWSKELLDGGKRKTQDTWVKWCKKNNWELPDTRVYYSTMKVLFAYQNDKVLGATVKKMIQVLRAAFSREGKWGYVMTGTRVVYRPQSPDVVFHRFKIPEVKIVEENIVGPHVSIQRDAGCEDAVQALFDTRDLQEVKDVITAIAGLPPQLWRSTQRPRRNITRELVLGCDVYGDYFVIGASAVFRTGGWPALGCVIGTGHH